MASELEVTTIRGLSSGADANKINIPSGQSLLAHGSICQTVESTITTRSVFSVTYKYNAASGLKVTITPKSANPILVVTANVVFSSAGFNAGYVLRDNTAGEYILFNADSPGLWDGNNNRKKLTSGGLGSQGYNSDSNNSGNEFGASSRSVSGLYTPPNNNAREIEVYLCAVNNTGNIYIGGNEETGANTYDSFSYSNIMIQEIVG